MFCLLVFVILSGGSRISQRIERQPRGRQTIIWPFIPRKLHEVEKLDRKRVACLAPKDPPMIPKPNVNEILCQSAIQLSVTDTYVSLRLRVKNRRKNGISRLISELCVNCLISIPEYSRIIDYQSSGCASGVDYFRNFTKLKNLNF